MDEQSLPIDIQLRKLLDWLISRRICNREWHDKIRHVRENIGQALMDMPEHPKIVDLLSGGSNVSYFHCLEIVDILKETEKDSKNFFGQYGSQRMSDWTQIVYDYKKDNIYLAEAAQLLTQAVAYELPGLKKQLAKLSKFVQEDCDKKEKDNVRKSSEFRAAFKAECKSLGISGERPRKEIIDLLQDLPLTYKNLALKSEQLRPAIKLYNSYSCNKADNNLPTLTFLMDKGNVTTYEWVHGEPPLSIEETPLAFDDDEVENVEIDLENLDLENVQLEAPVDIDWGDLEGQHVQDDEGQIDWDVSLEDIVVEEAGLSGGVAKNDQALSVLDNKKTRNLLLDDLHELSAFCSMRMYEMAKDDDSDTDIEHFVAMTNGLITDLTRGQLHHLQLVRSSPKYVDRLVEKLRHQMRLANRAEEANGQVDLKRKEAVEEMRETQRKVDLLMAQTRKLQDNVEKDISDRYKRRRVNIMGGVQTL